MLYYCVPLSIQFLFPRKQQRWKIADVSYYVAIRDEEYSSRIFKTGSDLPASCHFHVAHRNISRSRDLARDTIRSRLEPSRHRSDPTPQWALCRTYLEQIAGSDTAEPACLRLRCNTPCIHNRGCTHAHVYVCLYACVCFVCVCVCVRVHALRISHSEAKRHVHRMHASSIVARPMVAR